jgi:hypothetical protein
MNAKPFKIDGEKARAEVVSAVVRSYFSTIGDTIPSMVEKAIADLDLLPQETELVTVRLWVGLLALTVGNLKSVSGKPVSIPDVPEGIKALAAKHDVDLDFIRKELYGQ